LTTTPLLPTLPFLGTAYYPEHWPESRWKHDAYLLREAGVAAVRMMEFAWDKLEPRPGQYDMAWMDRALATFQEAGIKVVLCTPTPTPPPWLTRQHPEMLRIDDQTAQRAVPGSRRHVCCNVPSYQAASAQIVTAIADHFGAHPNVIGWQIDNEFGCHGTVRCICDYCRAAFQRWCQARYGSLDALNAAWGTQFWSATYTDWAEIPVPGPTAAQHNPGLLLDFHRFSSHAWVGYQKAQIDLLRPRIGERFITHNLMLKFVDMDYFDLARDLDFVSYDNYLHGMAGPSEAAFNLDIMRGLKGRTFWVIEQQPGPVNWTPFNPPVPPGQVRVWTHQALAHGADAVFYFRDRAVNIGQEQYHAGMLKHDGTPDRCWHESKAVSEDLARMPRLTRPKAPAAIMFDYEDLWVLRLDPHNHTFSYYDQALALYRQLWDQHIPVDIVPRSADLNGYEVVFVPSPALIDAGQAAAWRKYVEGGGKLVVCFRAFFKEAGNTWTDQPMPAGGLGDLLGVAVEEFFSIPPVPTVGLRMPGDKSDDWNDERGSYVNDIAARPAMGFGESFGLPQKTRYQLWAEVLRPSTAEVILRYGDGYYKDGAAATANKVGQGTAYYLGCWCEPILPRVVWQALGLQKHALTSDVRGSVVEIVRMQDESGQIVELHLNHTKRALTLPEKPQPEPSQPGVSQPEATLPGSASAGGAEDAS
jgi:beta-galactosidase